MNPTTAVRLQGYRIAFPGYLPWSPGSAIPFGGPQQLLQFYQDFNVVKGRHDFRFGGSYVHINDDRTFGAYANSVEALNTHVGRAALARQPRPGPAQPLPDRDQPRAAIPGGTYTTPVWLPELPQQEPLQRVRALRERQLERRRPVQAEPRRSATSTTGRRRRATRSTTRTSTTATTSCSVNTSSPPEMIDCIAQRAASSRPTRARSARCGRATGTTGRPAWASRGT